MRPWVPVSVTAQASKRMSQVRGPVVGRHSDSVDVTGPINMTGIDRRRRNLTLFAIVAAILIAATAVALLLAS